MTNLYLLQRPGGGFDEIEADTHEREGDDWVFHRSAAEVASIALDTIVSTTKAPVGLDG